jgi:DNA-directed RNA polymerase
VLDSITMGKTLQRAAVSLAGHLEDEVRFRLFQQEGKALWAKVTRDLDSRTKNEEHKRGVLIHSMCKASKNRPELIWSPWETTDKLHIGSKMIDLIIASTGMVELQTRSEGHHNTVIYVKATAKTLDWIQKSENFGEMLSPMLLPTIACPKPWVSPIEGGYHTKAAWLTLVKTKNANYLEELYHQRDQMPGVYKAVNAVQSTPWKIHTDILKVMQTVWDLGHAVGDMPSRIDEPLPNKPFDIDTNEEAKTQWKREASKVYSKNAKLNSRRMQIAKIMWVAEKFSKEEAIYFPHQLDFRGRLYATPTFLNPQGNDAAKALLTFKAGKALGESGLRWLKIHGANTYGEDKCSLEERAKWVDGNEGMIFACGADPLTNRDWIEADKPWQFLAFCMEYYAACKHPITSEYVSNLPVSVDGTCNGLQNFSAMLRDEIGGAAVNLVPSGKPQDIYQRVADVVRPKVEADAKGDGENAEVARQWLGFGFDRKATKRPVMVLPYGGTLFSSRSFVEDYINEKVEGGKESHWDGTFQPAAYLAKHIWSSIGEVVVAARSAMDWLQKSASLAAKEGLPVNWTTPVGFPVQQEYRDLEPRRVKTMIGNEIIKLTIQEEQDRIDGRRQAQGISPNFVHSMDACCLMMSVNRAVDAGITNFSMVHDSYGTLAANMETLAVELRNAFVDLYEHDVLQEFRDSLVSLLSEKNAKELPPVPAKGNLDLNAVKQSTYFFA